MQNLYLDMCRQRWWPRSAFIKQKSHLKDAQNVKIRSSCTGTKYHPGLCSPFIHSEVSNDTIIGGQWRKAPIRLCRLICVFAVHIILKTSFHMVRLILSLKVPYTIIADDILISVFFLFVRENKIWQFMWTDDSHEMPSLVFSLKNNHIKQYRLGLQWLYHAVGKFSRQLFEFFSYFS